MYAFVHIPKTAGTTLRYVFRRSFGANHCDVKCPTHCRASTPWLTARNLNLVTKLYPHLSGITGHRVCCFSDINSALPEVKYFTMLRDPLKRFISDFHHCYRGKMDQCIEKSLIEFAQNPIKRNVQTRWLCGTDNVNLAIDNIENKIGLVGITEQFDESLVLLKNWLNNPLLNINYEIRNRAHAKASLPFYSDARLLAIITEANQADITLYQHALNKVFPQQIVNYGENFQADVAHFKEKQTDFKDFQEPLWGKVKRDLLYKPMLHIPNI